MFEKEEKARLIFLSLSSTNALQASPIFHGTIVTDSCKVLTKFCLYILLCTNWYMLALERKIKILTNCFLQISEESLVTLASAFFDTHGQMSKRNLTCPATKDRGALPSGIVHGSQLPQYSETRYLVMSSFFFIHSPLYSASQAPCVMTIPCGL